MKELISSKLTSDLIEIFNYFKSKCLDFFVTKDEYLYRYELNKEKEANEIWFDGKPVYEQILKFELTEDDLDANIFTDGTEYSEIVRFNMLTAKDTKYGFIAGEGLSYYLKDSSELGVSIFNGKFIFKIPDGSKAINEDNPLTIYIKVYYTKKDVSEDTDNENNSEDTDNSEDTEETEVTKETAQIEK